MTTAFVFSGGGSHGAVQVGMLQALVGRVQPHFVVGASVGAINAVMFAAEPTADGVARLERTWRSLRREDIYPFSFMGALGRLFSRSDHLVSPARLRELLLGHLPCGQLEETRLPCHIIATDIRDGTEIRVGSGTITDALMATTAIPGIFPPVDIADRRCLDGGICSNTPIAAAVALGATQVIVLPTGMACGLDRPPRSSIAVALHAISLLIARQLADDVERFGRQATVVVVPPVCPLDVSPYDFSRTGQLIDQARESTARWLGSGGLERGETPASLTPHHHGSS